MLFIQTGEYPNVRLDEERTRFDFSAPLSPQFRHKNFVLRGKISQHCLRDSKVGVHMRRRFNHAEF